MTQPDQSRNPAKRHPRASLQRFDLLALTAGGLGLIPLAPGTWGSLPPVILATAMALLAIPHWMINVCILLLGLAGSIACVRFAHVGHRLFGRKDAPQIVADEVAGQSLALLMLPWHTSADPTSLRWNLLLVAMAFAAFRFFDITKPPPIKQVEALPSGWGVLFDDLIAGVYALALVHVILLLFF